MTFDQAFALLINTEGGYVFNPADLGGETKYGISKRSYPDVDIKNLTLDGARAIYLRDFWRADVDGALAFQLFDAAVNHGGEQAAKFLQRAVGVNDDGHIGPVTLARVNALPVCKVCMLFNAERILFYTQLHAFDTFGKGWVNRVARNMQLAAKE